MPSISCFSYRLFHNFTFIKYENYVKVFYNFKTIILTNEELKSNKILFQIFILSLLLTEDTSRVSTVNDNNKIKYGISTLLHWNKSHFMNYYGFVQLEKLTMRNPLNTMEPKRASGDKKKRKFFKLFKIFCQNDLGKTTFDILNEFITGEFKEVFDYFAKYIHTECKVNILSSIYHKYGNDIYRSVNRFV